jgi:phosphopantothenoylcysteine decarboxylase/phosphopantothenate--cysteine ligase
MIDMGDSITGKRIVLGVCGGIAAYKSAELLRLMIKQGASVRVVMTASATRFVGPMTFEVLSRQKVLTSLFEPHEGAAVRHIEWAQEADAVVIAPATANIIAKLANGIADDALSTFLLAVTCPVLICPSMNTHMFASRQVQRNLDLLKQFGYMLIEPASGELACGTTGPGRLPEPAAIGEMLNHMLSPKDLRGLNILITAGPTREAIDPVRFISNPSSGKMGYAIARAAELRGANVFLISGPTALEPPANVRVTQVTTAAEMAEMVLNYMGHADVVIKCAAVSDFRPKTVFDHKIKKDQADLVLELERTEDILKAVGERKQNQIVVGFAAESHQLETFAMEKLRAKNLDLIVANTIGGPGAGFESDTNRVSLLFKDGSRERIETMPKTELAHLLLDRIVRLMAA